MMLSFAVLPDIMNLAIMQNFWLTAELTPSLNNVCMVTFLFSISLLLSLSLLFFGPLTSHSWEETRLCHSAHLQLLSLIGYIQEIVPVSSVGVN